ncbi:MICOS complex subunit MIC19 [Spathaspora sp. JA1]|nr:MICOS complex subunit MIC19 [Spathaspora sp. JA1]
MGSNTSKPETKVFTPATPIDFSASFLSQLENTPESEFSRAQHTEKYIQERVAAELAKLEQQTIAQFQTTTNNALLTEQDKITSPSVSELNDKITKLTETLQENAKLAKIEVPSSITTSRQEVINCLKENQGKSLNCWEEVEIFKNLVKKL